MNVTLCVLFNSCIPDLDKHTVNRYLDKFWFLPSLLMACLSSETTTCTMQQLSSSSSYMSAKLMNAYFFLSHFFGCPYISIA